MNPSEIVVVVTETESEVILKSLVHGQLQVTTHKKNLGDFSTSVGQSISTMSRTAFNAQQ